MKKVMKWYSYHHKLDVEGLAKWTVGFACLVSASRASHWWPFSVVPLCLPCPLPLL